ncbi:MAG: dienelactone hydrolase family protein [Oligoflexia bacterium]|nr:dienelactone hydrolase family protein [Oligoflexia bacterium]
MAQNTHLNTVYLPSSGCDPKALLVVLHGLGDSVDGYRFLPGIMKVPSLAYLLVNAPDPYFTGYSWYDIMGNSEPGILRSRALLADLFKKIENDGWNLNKVGLLGFSQGCLMSIDFALTYPKQIACVVGISGYVYGLEKYPENFSPAAKKQKILVTHGTDDPLLPLERTESQISQLIGMGIKVDWKVYEKDHTIDPREEVSDIRNFLVSRLL